MEKPYSDRRWWDAPMAIDSECNVCIHDYGYGKCAKYPSGVPREIVKQSFPGTDNYNKNYCDMKKLKKTKK